MFPFPSGLEMEAVMIAFNWNVDWCFGEGLVGCMLESQREPIQLQIKKVGEILHNKKKQQSIIFTYSLDSADNVGTSFQHFTKKEGFFPIATIAGQCDPAKHRKATKTNTE